MVVSAGITLVDQLVEVHELPPHGGKRSGKCIAALPGGCAANTAAVAALSAPTKLLTALGDDDYGKQLKQAYNQLGVDLLFKRCVCTPASLVLIDAQGERTLITLSNGTDLSADDFPDFAINAGDLFFIYISDDKARQTLAERARTEGAQLVLPGKHLPKELAAGGKWPIVVASRDDVPRPTAKELKRIGCELFVFTAGAEGGEWWQHDRWQSFHTPYVAPEEIVDTCGAGDAFLGGLLAGLDNGLETSEAIEQGTLQGAACIKRSGAWPRGEWDLKPLLPH